MKLGFFTAALPGNTLEQAAKWGAESGFQAFDWAKFFAALTGTRYDYVVSSEHEDRAFEGDEELVKRGFYLSRVVRKPFIH